MLLQALEKLPLEWDLWASAAKPGRLHPSKVDFTKSWSVGKGWAATWCTHWIPYATDVIGATELAEERRSFKYRATTKGLAGNTSMHGNVYAHHFQPIHAERYLCKVTGALEANRTSGKPWARLVRFELHCISRMPKFHKSEATTPKIRNEMKKQLNKQHIDKSQKNWKTQQLLPKNQILGTQQKAQHYAYWLSRIMDTYLT